MIMITKKCGKEIMVLVDTSVIINYIKNVDDKYSYALQLIMDNHVPFGINSFIYQEILQGAKSEKEFEILKSYFSDFHFYELKDKSSFEKSALMNVLCRKKGITIRSTIDLLIAQTAIDNNLLLLTNDRDYENMAGVISELQLFEV